MPISEKQAELDVQKWLDSESAGYDLCGEFDFCKMCDKSIENPCAAAYSAFCKPKTKGKKASTKTAE